MNTSIILIYDIKHIAVKLKIILYSFGGKNSNKIMKMLANNNLQILIGFSFLFLAVSLFSQSNQWIAPKEADSLLNPYSGNEEAVAKGKVTYMQICSVCHGNKGKGDGIAGVSLNPHPSDLTSDIAQNQTDGAIFWKITSGNPPMAAYKDVLTEEQRWQLVTFIRTLKNTKKKKKK